MTASQTHIDMLPKLPEGFAWEVVPGRGWGDEKEAPQVRIVHWLEPGEWNLPDTYGDYICLFYSEPRHFPRDKGDGFYDYALKLDNGTLRRCDRKEASHYRSSGKMVAHSADLTDRWDPTELISVAKDTYELWQIRLVQKGLYGTYPPRKEEWGNE